MALLGAVVGVSAALFMNLSTRLWAVLTVVLAVVASAIDVYAPPELPQETETHGWLLSANDATPKTPCTPGQNTVKNWIFVTGGGSGVYAVAENKMTALTIGDHPTVLMRRGPSGLLVDVDMLDENGNLMVRIEENEWRVIPGEVAYESRPDRSTLVVYDKSGKEILWLRYLNPETVKFRGVFHIAGNPTPIVFGDNTIAMSSNLNFYAPFTGPMSAVTCLIIDNDRFYGPIFTIK